MTPFETATELEATVGLAEAIELAETTRDMGELNDDTDCVAFWSDVAAQLRLMAQDDEPAPERHPLDPPAPDADDMSPEGLEARAYDMQYDEIARECGQDAADAANYGWGVGGDEDHTSIATKVYGKGILSTYIDLKTGSIDHEWQD